MGLAWLLPAAFPTALAQAQSQAQPQVGLDAARAAQAGSEKGSAIVVGMMYEPVSFNPLRGIDSGSYYASSLVYEGLAKYNDDIKLVPALAESFSVSEDGLKYKFTLRKNLHFSSGEALTTGDVKASLALATSAVSPFRSDYSDISAVKITGAGAR